uniref:Uncharacterized protein n=1 Tax=Arundo donax TaxID=35708 RepID=A0A0A9DXK7_ARUDO
MRQNIYDYTIAPTPLIKYYMPMCCNKTRIKYAGVILCDDLKEWSNFIENLQQ